MFAIMSRGVHRSYRASRTPQPPLYQSIQSLQLRSELCWSTSDALDGEVGNVHTKKPSSILQSLQQARDAATTAAHLRHHFAASSTSLPKSLRGRRRHTTSHVRLELN